jgi:hypothetical protein
LAAFVKALGSLGYQTDDKCLTTSGRFARAFDDHETSEVVQE